MTASLIIAGVTCLAMILLVLIKPSIRIKNFTIGTYWLVCLLGAVVLISFRFVELSAIIDSFMSNGKINPLKILVLFISMTILSVYLDEAGLFKYLAYLTLRKAKSSQISIFLKLYLVVAILTTFTSNDIIVLTFTPFICYFAKSAKINPLPYLLGEFICANTWSMMLVIGNPTNIYLATASGIGFLEYLKIMALPTVLGGVSSLLILLLLFRKTLKNPLDPELMEVKIKDKGLLIIGTVHLSVCTFLLVLSSYIGFEMWAITGLSVVSLSLSTLVYSLFKKSGGKCLVSSFKRAPWELIPFVLSMFVIVLSLDANGTTQVFANLLNSANPVFTYGISSFFAANLINNIPMSMWFASLSSHSNSIFAVYAAIVGSNLGAFLTPVGALAGIMWTNILRSHEVKFSFLTFVKYGAIVAIPALAATLGGLLIFY